MNRRGFFKSLATIASGIVLRPIIPKMDEGINYNLHIDTKTASEEILADFHLLKTMGDDEVYVRGAFISTDSPKDIKAEWNGTGWQKFEY